MLSQTPTHSDLRERKRFSKCLSCAGEQAEEAVGEEDETTRSCRRRRFALSKEENVSVRSVSKASFASANDGDDEGVPKPRVRTVQLNSVKDANCRSTCARSCLKVARVDTDDVAETVDVKDSAGEEVDGDEDDTKERGGGRPESPTEDEAREEERELGGEEARTGSSGREDGELLCRDE